MKLILGAYYKKNISGRMVEEVAHYLKEGILNSIYPKSISLYSLDWNKISVIPISMFNLYYELVSEPKYTEIKVIRIGNSLFGRLPDSFLYPETLYEIRGF